MQMLFSKKWNTLFNYAPPMLLLYSIPTMSHWNSKRKKPSEIVTCSRFWAQTTQRWLQSSKRLATYRNDYIQIEGEWALKFSILFKSTKQKVNCAMYMGRMVVGRRSRKSANDVNENMLSKIQNRPNMSINDDKCVILVVVVLSWQLFWIGFRHIKLTKTANQFDSVWWFDVH